MISSCEPKQRSKQAIFLDVEFCFTVTNTLQRCNISRHQDGTPAYRGNSVSKASLETKCKTYLFTVLGQNVVEFHHHLLVDGVTGADVLEVQEHVKSGLRGAKGLEGLVDKHLRFFFYILDMK